MKVGDMVKINTMAREIDGWGDEDWVGVIVGWELGDPVVYWSSRFPKEREYKEQLVVISEK